MNETSDCPYCGARISGGYTACRTLMDEFTVRLLESQDAALNYAVHRAAVDCYCLQHPEVYCVSVKSYAAHLTGLCAFIEYPGREDIHPAVQRWLNGGKSISRPPVPLRRGSLNVTHLQCQVAASDLVRQLQAWASDIWAAYHEQQPVARQYIQSALRFKR
jgi:hypothetical protein